jgi:hypothetical protein
MLQTFEYFLQDLMLLTELHISLTEEHAGQQLKGGKKPRLEDGKIAVTVNKK